MVKMCDPVLENFLISWGNSLTYQNGRTGYLLPLNSFSRWDIHPSLFRITWQLRLMLLKAEQTGSLGKSAGVVARVDPSDNVEGTDLLLPLPD